MTNPNNAQPVLIPLEFPLDDDNNNNNSKSTTLEWAMIEINGELLQPTESMSSSTSQENALVASNQVELGSLWFDAQQTPHLIVGSHECKGKIEKLKQPFCVLEKQQGQQSPQQEDNDNDDNNIRTSYAVQGLITHKLLFQQYPKTILSSSSAS